MVLNILGLSKTERVSCNWNGERVNTLRKRVIDFYESTRRPGQLILGEVIPYQKKIIGEVFLFL